MWPIKLNVILLTTTLVNTQLPQRYNDQVYFEDSRPTNVKYTISRIPAQPILYNRGDNERYQDHYEVNESKRRVQMYGQVRPVVPMMDKGNPVTRNRPGDLNGLTNNGTFSNQGDLQSNNGTLAQAAYGIINLGLLFLKNVDPNPSQNAVLSPFSIAISLGLLEQGAQGDTQKEIASALQMTPDVASAAFKTILSCKRGSSSNNILDIATSIFADSSLLLNPTFVRMATESFKSDVIPVTFSNTVEAANVINNWVEDKTKHKIQKIISSDSLRDSVIVLANAVYFKGTWQSKFNPEATTEKEFTLGHTGGDQKKNVPFMQLRGGFKIGYDKNIKSQILILPFQKEEYNFMIILPDQFVRLSDVITRLQVDKLLSYNEIPMKEAHIEIPKFTIRSDMDLKGVLQKMGITKLFSPRSELYGLVTANQQSPYISAAVHSSVLSIDESGGTAAAATAFAGVPLSFEDNAVHFKANRPFLALIWHGELKIPLFTAIIEDPTL